MSKLWTVREIAKKVGLTYAGVYAWIRQNNLKCKKVGFAVVVRDSDLQKFLTLRQAPSK